MHKNRKTGPVAVILFLVLLIGLAVGGWMLLRGNGVSGTTGSTESTHDTIGSTDTIASTETTGIPETTGSIETTESTETAETTDSTEVTDSTEATEATVATEPPTEPPTEQGTEPPLSCTHDYAVTTLAATCDRDGSKTSVCKKCGDKVVESLKATGHRYGDWSIKTGASCENAGEKQRICTKCQASETEKIQATGHNWDSGKVTTTPTSCSDMGIKTYTCQTCGKTKTEQIQGNHTFGNWQWEEYTYTIDYGYTLPGGSQYATHTSHRKIRICEKCDYKETDGTPNHPCTKGCANHTVTTVKEGTCTTKATMRSTCKVCGWYVEYEGSKGKCTWVDKKVHLSDYGPYTNELDATVSECTSCGDRSVVYHKGEGWSDYNRYRVNIGVTQGSAYAPASPINDNMTLVDHPEWQTVKRDFVYDSDGYVKQFTIYWWYNGSRYSHVIKCGAGEIEAWFAQYGLTGSSSSAWTVKIYGTYVQPYSVGYSA